MKGNNRIVLIAAPVFLIAVILFTKGFLTVRAAAGDFMLHLPLVLKSSDAPTPTATNALTATNTPTATATNTPTPTATNTPTPTATEDPGTNLFEGVPPPEMATFNYEIKEPNKTCRFYTSSATPYSVVSQYATLLGSSPYDWNVGTVFKTGYGYDDTASFLATKDVRTMQVEGNGIGGFKSSMSVCISIR